jgi:hypothetical protein
VTGYFIIVATEEFAYGEGGGHDYTALAGVIGPFDTSEEALAYDRERFLTDSYYKTEIVKMTAPGEGQDGLWENQR